MGEIFFLYALHNSCKNNLVLCYQIVLQQIAVFLNEPDIWAGEVEGGYLLTLTI